MRTNTGCEKMNFSLLVKPAGAECNLACGYCFYKEKARLYRNAPRLRMEERTLKRLLEQYHDGNIAFQGGEPTLMGLEFFRKAQAMGRRVNFSLQTNGTMIDGEWAEFLAENNWLTGISIDGRKEVHEKYRQGFDRVMSGYRAMQKAGAMVNTLTLVTAANIGRAAETYRFLRDEVGSLNQQYIECTTPKEFAIDGEKWGDFLIELFDTWLNDGDARRVSVRLFDAMVARMAYGRAEVCQFARDCRNYLVVEWNGDVYPCDFNVRKELRLGNIMTDSLEDMFASEKFRRFGMKKREWAKECEECEFLAFCNGDCPKNREPGTNRSILCKGYKRFFAHALPILHQLLIDTK